MKILRLSAKHFKETEYYYKVYIGDEDVSAFDGSIEIEGGLGWVKFASLYASRHIIAEAGTGIKAGRGIEAGDGIEAGTGIEAGWGIKAGDGIKAGRGIEAGWGIKAGDGIEAGWGIKAGLSIVCKATIKFKYRLFAGVATFNNKLNEDAKVVCGRLNGGVVCYGNVAETLKESKDD